jgi:hypothetical protein
LKFIQTVSAYAQSPAQEIQPGTEPAPLAAPLSPAAGFPAAAPPTGDDTARRQLVDAAIKLQMVLDAEWRQYLALPAEAYEVGGQPSIDVLRRTLARYDAVAAKPIYASLAQRPEFTSAHEALRQYIAAAAGAGQVKLPPPPSQETNFFNRLPQ